MGSFTFMAAPVLASAAMLITTLSIPSVSGATLNGIVQTGGACSTQPLAQAHVTLFEATTGQPTVIGQTTTDAFGHFSIPSTKNISSNIFHVSADVGERVEFLTVLGTRLPATVTINELTTVAASYSMAQFYKTDVISGNSFGLQIAAGMNDNIVTPVTGESSFVLLTSPTLTGRCTSNFSISWGKRSKGWLSIHRETPGSLHKAIARSTQSDRTAHNSENSTVAASMVPGA